MKKFLIGLVTVLVIIGVWFVVYNLRSDKSVDKVIGQTVDWKTYQNKEYGYSVKYSVGWVIDQGGDGTGNLTIRKNSNMKPGQPGDFWVDVLRLKWLDTYKGAKTPVPLWESWLKNNEGGISSITRAVVGGVKATKAEFIKGTSSGPSTSYYLEKNGNQYQINILFNDPRDYVGDEILSTFRFTK